MAREELRRRAVRDSEEAKDAAYREAHIVNAMWQDEVIRRREQEDRQREREIARRKNYEQKIRDVVVAQNALFARSQVQRDWLLVASEYAA